MFPKFPMVIVHSPDDPDDDFWIFAHSARQQPIIQVQLRIGTLTEEARHYMRRVYGFDPALASRLGNLGGRGVIFVRINAAELDKLAPHGQWRALQYAELPPNYIELLRQQVPR